jgi:tRNA uridine 5-carbamoylmethylation protein Kti12
VEREAVRGVGPESACALIHAFVSDATLVLASAATVRLHHADAEMVYALDSVSQQVVARVDAHQREQLQGTPVVFPEFDRALTLNSCVALAELQRHRRQFVRVNTLYAPKDKSAIGAAFVDFLCNNI